MKIYVYGRSTIEKRKLLKYIFITFFQLNKKLHILVIKTAKYAEGKRTLNKLFAF